jgi:hypothetical protein
MHGIDVLVLVPDSWRVRLIVTEKRYTYVDSFRSMCVEGRRALLEFR